VKYGNQHDAVSVLKELGIPTKVENGQNEWAVTFQDKEGVRIEKRRIENDKVPNVVGMGLMDALFILENMGLKVEFKGSGTIIRQSLSKGGSYKNGQEIKLELG